MKLSLEDGIDPPGMAEITNYSNSLERLNK